MTETKREFWIIRKVLSNAHELRTVKPSWDEIELGDERIHVIEKSALSSLETKLQKAVELIQKLDMYAIHARPCGHVNPNFPNAPFVCTCGLTATRELIKELESV